MDTRPPLRHLQASRRGPSCRLAFVAFSLIALLGMHCTHGSIARSAGKVPTSQEIESAVHALGDAKFGVRQEASRFLWEAGRTAEPALDRALQSEDAEVVDRVQRVLRRFRYGIYCDTPDEVVELIGQYRFGKGTTKATVLKALRDMGEIATLLTLVRSEADEGRRNQLLGGLLKDLDAIVGRLFIDGEWTKAEQLLRVGTLTDKGIRDHAAYLVLRGGIDRQIDELRRRAAEDSLSGDAKRNNTKQLAYCLRAKGDLQGALAAAEHAEDDTLTEGLLFELGRWNDLADRYEAVANNLGLQLIYGGIVHLGYLAAYHRLSGNVEPCDRAVASIKKLAKSKSNKVGYCAEALMINDRLGDALELFKKHDSTSEFETLCLQYRFGEALALAGMEDPGRLPSSWFDEPDKSSTERPTDRDRFDLKLTLGKTLVQLGHRETAVELFSQLAQTAEENNPIALRIICRNEIEAGLKDEAFGHAAAALSGPWRAEILHSVFPDDGDVAEDLCRILRMERAADSPSVFLHRIRELLDPSDQVDVADDGWKDDVMRVERESQRLTQASRVKCLLALAETCVTHDHRTMARQYFEKANKEAPSATVMIRLGDLCRRDELWKDAADWYRKAWHADRSKPVALYLQGRALIRAGKSDEGRMLIEAARLIPLGNAETRCEFGEQLHERGFEEEALAQWELTVRTGEPQVWPVHRAAECLGLQTVGKDDLQAAEYLQRPLLKCLQSSTAKWEIGDYLRRVYLIHKLRARGLLAAGRAEEAAAEIELARSTLPGRIELAMELVPMLEAAGRRAEADELFARVYDVNDKVCTQFASAAGFHHDLAVLGAQCGRRLDESLKHAERAVALFPDNRAYLDTLIDIRQHLALESP